MGCSQLVNYLNEVKLYHELIFWGWGDIINKYILQGIILFIRKNASVTYFLLISSKFNGDNQMYVALYLNKERYLQANLIFSYFTQGNWRI